MPDTPAEKPADKHPTREQLEEIFRLFTETERAQMVLQANKWLKKPDEFESDMIQWQLVTLQITKKIAHGEIVLPMKGWAQIQYRALEALPDLIDTVLETIQTKEPKK